MAIIASKYKGRCRQCSRAYGVGEEIFWSRGTGSVCLPCHQGSPRPVPAPRATTSAPAPTLSLPSGPTTLSNEPLKLPPQLGSGTHSVRVWESFDAYVESGKTTKPIPSENCWNPVKPQFYGTGSWDEMMALADQGWDEVRPEVDALVEKIDDKLAPVLQPAFTSCFDVAGGSVDVGRFLDGEPECMVETRLVNIAKPGRVITLLVNGSVMASASTTDIITRGSAIVALVDCLEKMQHNVEIWLEMSCAREFGGTPDKMPVLTHLVKVKSAGDSLDIDMLMFAIAHPARHRRLTFALRRNEPNSQKFGMPMECTVPVTQKDNVGATLVLESLSNAGKTVSAETWILETLSEFGLVREEGE